MKLKPIKEPKLIGCLNCSPILNKKLPKNYKIFEGFDTTCLEIDNKFIDIPKHKSRKYGLDYYKLTEITAIVEKIKKFGYAWLTHSTPLHEETYEYNRIDGYWYLVKQGLGFA